jgi:hypothetical protein
MRILKAVTLAAVVVLAMAGSSWADSVMTPSAFQADLQIVQTSIAHNLSLYSKSPDAQGAFLAGNLAGIAAIFQSSFGSDKLAQVYFQTAIADFNQVLSILKQAPLPGTSYSAPDAGALALLGCTGIALFGAVRKKYSS